MTTGTTPRKRAATKRTSPRAAAKPAPAVIDVDAELAKIGMVGDDGPIGEDGSIRPVEIGKRGRTPNPMVDLFSLDGGQSYYQVPAKPPAMLAFRFQDRLMRTTKIKDPERRKAAQQEATREMFVDLLGQEALDALATSPEVTTEDVEQIFAIIAHLCFGAVKKVEDAQGN